MKAMLLAVSNVHFRNNLILGQSETLETFAIESNTNYSDSDYNGFRPNEGAQFSFEWSTPPLSTRAIFPGEMGKPSTQQQAQLEAKSREQRRFRTLKSIVRPLARIDTACRWIMMFFRKFRLRAPIRGRSTSQKISISSFVQARLRWTRPGSRRLRTWPSGSALRSKIGTCVVTGALSSCARSPFRSPGR